MESEYTPHARLPCYGVSYHLICGSVVFVRPIREHNFSEKGPPSNFLTMHELASAQYPLEENTDRKPPISQIYFDVFLKIVPIFLLCHHI